MNKIINGVASEYDMPMKYENKTTTIFIDNQAMEERYGEQLYQEYLEKENKELKEKLNRLENKYSKALELLVDFNLPCEQRMFMDRYSEWCELNCSVSDECYKKCWNKYIESELEKSKSE